MKVNYLLTLIPIVLTTGLLQPVTQAQAITQITISTPTQVESQFIKASGSDIEPKENTNRLLFGRESIVLVSRKKDPSPPRPSPPGGSRYAPSCISPSP